MSLVTRWETLVNLLKSQRGAAPEPTLTSTRRAIRSLYDRAKADLMPLPAPGYDDEAFIGMDFTSDIAREVKAAIDTTAFGERKRAYNRAYQKARDAKISKAMKFNPRQPQSRPGTKTCGCGCGLMTRRDFYHGHGSRWWMWMRRIERGTMKREDLPPYVLKRIKWQKCCGCGGWMPIYTIDGAMITPRLGLDCQIRKRYIERKGHGNNSNPVWRRMNEAKP